MTASLTLAAARGAQAQNTYYTSATAFANAVSNQTSFNFNGYDTGNTGSTRYPSGLTVQGVTFTDAATRLYVFSPSGTYGNPYSGGQYLEADSGTLNITLPAGTKAFAGDFFDFEGSHATDPFTLTVNGQSTTFNVSSTTSTFFGVTSSTPFTSLTVSTSTSSTSSPALDNVRFGSTLAGSGAAAPEPGSIGLLALGAVGALPAVDRVARRRRAA